MIRRFHGWRPTTRRGRNALFSLGLIAVSPILGFVAAEAAVSVLGVPPSDAGSYLLFAIALTTAFIAGAHWVAVLLGERSELVLMLAVALTAAAIAAFLYIPLSNWGPLF
ncbi:hypothetical protein J2W21_002493 [Sinomonas atrocyanea]|uniref:hypothetical protein n=1 Tax=Sinomonas atrocyanea TaxID=37927 RepID=UPI0027824CF3|nr:hypothetical protein [Sinomonas atrocyanea]MDP9884975.1 hypothetical protein [Sinomonas atrocyanea]